MFGQVAFVRNLCCDHALVEMVAQILSGLWPLRRALRQAEEEVGLEQAW